MVLPQWVAMEWESYSIFSQYISEMGEHGSPYFSIINYGSFLPTGFFIILFGLMLSRSRDTHYTLKKAGLYYTGVGIAYVGSVLFPCNPGCPLFSTDPSQIIHNSLAIIEYGGGMVALYFWGVWYNAINKDSLAQFAHLSIIIVFLAFLAMVLPDLKFIRGLAQRIGELTLFTWMMIVAISLVKANRD